VGLLGRRWRTEIVSRLRSEEAAFAMMMPAPRLGGAPLVLIRAELSKERSTCIPLHWPGTSKIDPAVTSSMFLFGDAQLDALSSRCTMSRLGAAPRRHAGGTPPALQCHSRHWRHSFHRRTVAFTEMAQDGQKYTCRKLWISHRAGLRRQPQLLDAQSHDDRDQSADPAVIVICKSL
jgi:hypothetical protein